MFLKLLKGDLEAIYRPVSFAGPDDGGKTPPDGSTESPDAGKDSVDKIVAGIDFSDVPEDIREQVKAKTASRIKHFQSDYTKKTEETARLREKLEGREKNLAEWMKIKEQYDEDPKLQKMLNQMWSDYHSGTDKQPTKTEIKEGLKLIDQRIAQADDAQTKEDLRALRAIIQEEAGTNVTKLQKKIEELEGELKLVKSTTHSVRLEKVSSEIKELKDRFGAELVDKYVDDIRALAVKKGSSPYSVFKLVASDEDLQAAFLAEAKAKEKTRTKRKKEGLEPAADVSIPAVEVPRDRTGKVNIRDFVRKIVDKHSLAGV